MCGWSCEFAHVTRCDVSMCTWAATWEEAGCRFLCEHEDSLLLSSISAQTNHCSLVVYGYRFWSSHTWHPATLSQSRFGNLRSFLRWPCRTFCSLAQMTVQKMKSWKDFVKTSSWWKGTRQTRSQKVPVLSCRRLIERDDHYPLTIVSIPDYPLTNVSPRQAGVKGDGVPWLCCIYVSNIHTIHNHNKQ